MGQLSIILNQYYINSDVHDKFIQILYYVGAFEKEIVTRHFQQLSFINEEFDNSYHQSKEDIQYFLNLIKSANCHAVLEKDDTKNSCDSSAILAEFNFKYITNAHDWLVKVTQERIYARTGERWNTKTPDWMLEYAKPLSKLAQDFGLTSEIMPIKYNISDAVAFFGSTGVEVEKRLKCIDEKIDNNQIFIHNRIYLLTGKRYIETSESGMRRDKGSEYLLNLSSKIHKDLKEITEADIMQDISHFMFNKSFPNNIIATDAPNAPGKDRPNTVTTLEEFTRVKHTNDKKILFVSRNPNIFPQREDVIKVMSSLAPNIDYEVIGCGLDNNELVNVETNVHRVLMPLAAGIYSGYDRVKANLEELGNRDEIVQHDEL